MTNPDLSVQVAKTIDEEFANSPYETKTDTEKAFAASFVKQMGNIEFLILTVGGVVFFTLLLVTGNTMAIAVRERVGRIGRAESAGILQPIRAAAGDDGIPDCRTHRGRIGIAAGEIIQPAWRSHEWHITLLLFATFGNCERSGYGAACGSGRGNIARGIRDAPACGRCDTESLIVAIPVIYNLRSVRARWTSAIVAILGIAGTVSVFVAMMSLARGFKMTLVSSGSPQNAMVRRAGSTSEIDGAVSLEQVKVITDAPGIARSDLGPLLSAEVVVIAAFPLKSSGTNANVQVRGVSPAVLRVRDNVKIIAGRFLQPGLNELVVGKNATVMYQGLALGDTIKFGGGTWNVVGIFDAGGSAFDSEVWGDVNVLNQVYHRPENVFQSITVHLTSPDAMAAFKDSLTSDPRMTVQVDRERDYYDKQSRNLTTLIVVLGTIIAVVMGIGAVFGALNTMYSAVAERSREIATMRALGFGAGSVVLSFSD